MKKVLSLLLALSICLPLCACGGANNHDDSNHNESSNPVDNTEPQNTTEHGIVEDKYQAAIGRLQEYLSSGYFQDKNVSDEWFSGNAALNYLYESFIALDGYKDSAEYVSRFTVMPDKLCYVVEIATDNSGNIRKSIDYEYTYNKDGTIIILQGTKANEDILGGPYPYRYFYEYNEDGSISKITAKVGDDMIDATITPQYDSSGNMVYRHVQWNNHEETHTFSYDSNGNCIASQVGGYQSEYTYDISGKLLQEKRTILNKTIITTYTYDQNGRILAGESKIDMPASELSSIVHQYIYGDYYIYNP